MIIELLITQILLGNITLHTSLNFPKNINYDPHNRNVTTFKNTQNSLIAKLNNPDITVRIKTLTEIGDKNIKSAFNHLLYALNDEDYRIRGTAAISLGKLNEIEAIPYLIQTLNDNQAGVRGAAALSLGRLKAIEASDKLITLLNDDDTNVILSATYSLSIMGSQKAIKPIMKLLNNNQASIRENAAWALGFLKAKEALPILNILTQDPDDSVRISAKRAIFQIKYSLLSDTSNIKYNGGNGSDFKHAVKITGIKNSLACLKSQKEFINKFYGKNTSWEQVEQTHVKIKDKHYTLITVKENSSGNIRKFYFDITELFSKF